MHAFGDDTIDKSIGDVREKMRHAFAGASMTVDRHVYSLHDLTQLALAMQPRATLAIQNAETMTPIERASIATVGRGHVVFN